MGSYICHSRCTQLIITCSGPRSQEHLGTVTRCPMSPLNLLQHLSQAAVRPFQRRTHAKQRGQLTNAFSTSTFLSLKISFLNCLFRFPAVLIFPRVKDVSTFMQQKLPNNKDHYNISRFLEVHWHRIKKQPSPGVKVETATQNYFTLTGKANTLF